MARRKTSHRKKPTTKRRSRRRRIGAISSDTKTMLMHTLAGIGGAIAAGYITTTAQNALEKVDSLEKYADAIGASAPIVLGFFLPKLVKQKSPMLTGFQQGLMIAGGLNLVKAFDILPGIAGVPFVAGVHQDAIDFRSQRTPMVAGANRNIGVGGMAAMAH